MTPEDYTLSPFDRRLVGRKNEYLVRQHRTHAATVAEAIRRREQPGWSQYREDVRAA